jgi:quercetin dioxygenase-like cupin family protein
MIRPGEHLENPVTGEVLIFHETAAETAGERVRVEAVVKPNGFVAAAHVHPSQTERFDMLEGALDFRLGKEIVQAKTGDEIVVAPGTPHQFWNPGAGEARFLLDVRPALKFESLIETMFTLAAEGKTGSRGLPNPLRLAVIAREHFDTVQLPFPPAALQRAALAVGAPIGRAIGYDPTVERPTRRDEVRAERERRYDRGRPHDSRTRRGT